MSARLASETLERVQARRRRHRRRALPVRALAVAGGALLVLLAALLLLPLPEAGLPLGACGLGLLALEFDWAARTLACAIETAGQGQRWLRRLPRRVGLAGAAAGAVAVVLTLGAVLALAGLPPF